MILQQHEFGGIALGPYTNEMGGACNLLDILGWLQIPVKQFYKHKLVIKT